MRGHDIKPVAALLLAAAIWAGLAASLAVGASARGANAQAPLGGINIGMVTGIPVTRVDHEIALARRLHAKLVRVEVQWSAFSPGPGQINAGAQSALDRLMVDASAAHMHVIAFVDRTPCWASSAPATLMRSCKPGKLGGANAWPPREASALGAFTGWLAGRYGASALAAIEVWNEPDQANQDYLAGPSKVRHYAELLRAAYPAVKRANPHVLVLGGSLVGSNGAFMQALYRAGIKGYYDGVAVHFYNLTLASLRAFHEVQLANHDYKPLWLDEFGWSSCLPAHRIQQEQACVTSRVQAQNVADAVRELAHTPYVAAQTLYKLQDSPQEDFGVLSERGTPKPSFRALAKALSKPFDAPDRVTLSLRAKHGQVIASGAAPVGDYMRLEAFISGALRYRAIFTLDRFNRYSLALPAVLGTHGITVRVYQYWLGPGHDAQRSI